MRPADHALEKCANGLRNDGRVRGFLWFGSAQRNEADMHSDLDLYAAVSGSMKGRESHPYDEWTVEILFNPAEKA